KYSKSINNILRGNSLYFMMLLYFQKSTLGQQWTNMSIFVRNGRGIFSEALSGALSYKFNCRLVGLTVR
ncbi:MAG: hypothetical protein COX51_06485, partial [Syntrophobacteraceae bacterium CG23_combo_of_CG06-09_8_20_14_all_50_8]